MRAVVLHKTGGPEELVLDEIPTPTPGPDQVLVRVEAAAVSVGETQMRDGTIEMMMPLPATFGVEAAGTIEAVGDDVDESLIGQRVVGITPAGSYAEFTVAYLATLTRIPDNLSATDAVAAAAPGATALGLLSRAAIKPGETVLVEGGSGNVGGYLIRHAHEAGAHVIATASTKTGRNRATKRGADTVIDHTYPDWPTTITEPPDVVFDMYGGTQTGQLLDITNLGGRFLVYGRLSGESPVIPWTAFSRGLTLIGCGGPVWYRELLETHYADIVKRLANNETHRQNVNAELPLDQAAEAHRKLENREPGRVILIP